MLPTIATAVIAWLHIFAAIGWLGAIMAFGMVVGPGLVRLTPAARFEFFAKIAPRFLRYAVIFAGVTLLFGAALAYALYDVLFSPLTIEGTYIIVGAIVAIIVFLFGLFVVEPTVHKIAMICENLLRNPGAPPPEFAGLQKQFRSFAALAMVLLIVVLVLMIGAGWT